MSSGQGSNEDFDYYRKSGGSDGSERMLRRHYRKPSACSLIGADRSTIQYRSCRSDNAALRGRLRALAQERRRFGYRRLFVLLR